MYKLFVSGFPLEITEMELAKLVGPHGDIATIKIVRDKRTKICKGYAFIEMESLMDADNTVFALDGITMVERVLTVKVSGDKPAEVKPRFSRLVADVSTGYAKPAERLATKRDKRPRF